jgi:hypothetical protein
MGLASSPQLPSGFQILEHAFFVEAFTEAGTPVFSFLQPFTMTIQYNEPTLRRVFEESLAVKYWETNTKKWVTVPTNLQVEINELTISLDHLTTFAVIGEIQNNIFLPTVLKNE